MEMTTPATPDQKTVLIVEDEDSLRFAMTYIFRANGYKIVEASNGTLAYEVAMKQNPDIIVSDVCMPHLDGVDLLRKIRDRNNTAPLFFLVSGFTDLQPFEAYDMGVDGMFAKPFDRVTLLSAIKERLRPLKERLAAAEGAAFSPTLVSTNVELGRGGFFVPLAVGCPAENSKVDFKVEVSGHPEIKLEGQGIVRWTRHAAKEGLRAGCGVEIEKLSPASLEVFMKHVEGEPTKTLIPQGLG